MVNGIDVSAYQENVSFQAVREAGYSFAYVKATESTDYTSSTFASQWQGAGAAGMLRGGYHFFDFNADAAQQAQLFLSVCPPAKVNAWGNWTFWQYSQSGEVPGIAGSVDLDVYNGSLSQLEELCQK